MFFCVVVLCVLLAVLFCLIYLVLLFFVYLSSPLGLCVLPFCLVSPCRQFFSFSSCFLDTYSIECLLRFWLCDVYLVCFGTLLVFNFTLYFFLFPCSLTGPIVSVLQVCRLSLRLIVSLVFRERPPSVCPFSACLRPSPLNALRSHSARYPIGGRWHLTLFSTCLVFSVLFALFSSPPLFISLTVLLVCGFPLVLSPSRRFFSISCFGLFFSFTCLRWHYPLFSAPFGAFVHFGCRDFPAGLVSVLLY